MFQKRWVKFDGDSISYYNNEKVSDIFGHVWDKMRCVIHTLPSRNLEIITNEYASLFHFKLKSTRIRHY